MIIFLKDQEKYRIQIIDLNRFNENLYGIRTWSRVESRSKSGLLLDLILNKHGCSYRKPSFPGFFFFFFFVCVGLSNEKITM